MDRSRRDRLLQCILDDDSRGFGEFISSEILSAVFGRFPLLSLLYLFDARRIVKKYFSDLVKERPRTKEAPFRMADDLFAEKAGKCLRYYLSDEVSPLEMLAVLGRRRALEKLYAVYPGASRVLPMIHKIYFTRLGEGVTVLGDRLILPKEPLSFGEKRSFTRFALLFSVLFCLIVAATSFLYVYYGVGSAENYTRVHTSTETISALQADRFIALEKDVTLSVSITEYGATMEGGDHIVRLSAPFAEKLTGEIHDVIFYLTEDFVGDAVILENEGVLKNVRVVAEGLTLEKKAEEMGLLTTVNRGTIEGCTAVVAVTLSGEGGGDCYFAPFTGHNYGTIHNCTTDGSISALNADIAGIAGKNAEDGVITDCVVKGSLIETANIANWTPNVAGVTVQNDGTIYQCTVSSGVTARLSAPAIEENSSPASSYAAGIACLNGGSIKSCENQGAILSESTNGYAFAGGMVSINAHFIDNTSIRFGTIEFSTCKGQVKAFSFTHLAYAAGVAAENAQGGTIRECTVTESVIAEVRLAEGIESSAAAAYAGGVAALNLDLVTGCRISGSVTATSDGAYSFAGGAVALNSYVLYQSYYYIGTVTDTLCGGAVRAESSTHNAYAGGIAAENNQGKVSACGQSGSVTASAPGGTVFDFVGGIVGYNYGTVESSFFTGSLSTYDEDSFVGGICGLIRLPLTLRISMGENLFSAGAYTSGAVIAEGGYRDLRAGYIYALAFFESNASYNRYISEILALGGTSATVEEIKASEVYYE